MYISRVYIRNYKNFDEFDLFIPNGDPLTIIGGNNAGKTNLLKAIRLVLDSTIPPWEKRLSEDDFCWSKGDKPWVNGEEVVITITFKSIDNKEEINSLLYSLSPVRDDLANSLEANISFVFAPSTYKKNSDYDLNEDYISFLVAGRYHPSGFFYTEDGTVSKYDDGIIKNLHSCDNVNDFYKYFYLSGEDIEKITSKPEESFEKKITKQMYANRIRKHVNLLFLDAVRDVKNDFNLGYNSLISQLFRADIKNNGNKKMISELSDTLKLLRSQNLIPETDNVIKEIENRLQSKNINLLSDKADLTIGTPKITLENIGRYFNFIVNLNEDLKNSLEMSILGLGYQNLSYISAIFALFELKKEIFANDIDEKIKIIFNLLLIEEPEAHLDVQNQKFLHTQIEKKTEKLSAVIKTDKTDSEEDSENNKFFAFTQVIQTSHSTHLASKSDLKNIVVMEKNTQKTRAINIDSILKEDELTYRHKRRVLKQYLDATRSALLFARKVVLVEGLSEKYALGSIINSYLKKQKNADNIDMDSKGIEIIEVGGKNFQPFSSLYSPGGLKNKCLSLHDGDSHLGVDINDYNKKYTDLNIDSLDKGNLYTKSNIFTFEIDTFFIPKPDDANVNNVDYLKLILHRFMKDGDYFKKIGTFNEKIDLISALEKNTKEKTLKNYDVVGFFNSIMGHEVSKPTLALYLSSLLKAKLLNDPIELETWKNDYSSLDNPSIKSIDDLPDFIIPKYIEDGLLWLITD